MDALSNSGWIDTLNRGGWMVGLDGCAKYEWFDGYAK